MGRMADKLVIVRSLVGNQSDHDEVQVFNGHHPRRATAPGGWPQLGSAVAKVQGPVDRATPPFVSLCYTCTHGPYNEPGPGFLGTSFAPFRPTGPARDDMVLRGVTLGRLGDRRDLRRGFDRFTREADAPGATNGVDTVTVQPFGLLTSPPLADAIDLS